MSKETNKDKVEDVVDAKGAAATAEVATAQATALAEVQVEGARLEFPFVRIGQGMSQWRTPETKNGKPEEGAFYVGKTKETNWKLADAGKSAGLEVIILDKVDGFKEDRAYTPGDVTPPTRWVVGQLGPDGNPMDEAACLADAGEKGFSLVPRATGEVWPDTGRPKMRANLGRFCYLLMLAPVPETLETDELRLYPIGDRLYTTVRMEFDRQYYKNLDTTLGNIASRAKFAFVMEQKRLLTEGKLDKEALEAAVASWKFTVNGLLGHVYSFETTNRQGIQYTSHAFERATVDGRPRELTAAEKEDFVKFLMAAKAGMASVDDASTEF